jgi:hypothetical protein
VAEHQDPGLPRKADGKVNLAAPAPRTGGRQAGPHRDLAAAGGQGELNGLETLRVDPADMKPWAIELQQQRSHDYFKSRPDFMCRPSGMEAEAYEREKRILQTPAMIAVLNANQTYRRSFSTAAHSRRTRRRCGRASPSAAAKATRWWSRATASTTAPG